MFASSKVLAMTLLGAGLSCAPIAMAQQSTTSGNTPVTVTGCLAQGDSANEYSIKGDDGKTYGLMASGSVNMKPHVGHKVTITGTPSKASASTETKGAKTGRPEESEHLQVSDLKMVSTTCP
jgi:hypothetical protein